jgi:hypothetical protein
MNSLPEKRRPWLGATAVALLLAMSACGGQEAVSDPEPAGSASPGVPGPLDADAVAIRVDITGGFVPASAVPGRLPVVSVYGDGRVITEGPVPAIYPGPALPNLQQRRIPAGDVALLVRKALDAGVGSGADFGLPTVTDMPNTRVTVATSEGVRQSQVYGLQMVEEGPNRVLTDAQRAARDKLRALVDELQNPPTATGEPEPYPASALVALATEYRNQADLPSPPPAVAWAGPALPGEMLGPGNMLGCVTVTGDAAKTILATAAKANAATPWTSDGKTWRLLLRPLLPDESGCADLAARR